MPPLQPFTSVVTNEDGSSQIAISNTGASAITASAGAASTTTILVVIMIIAILVAVGTVCLVRRFIKGRGTSTIVKAVPVTTIANPVASPVGEVSAASVETGEVQMSVADEGEETKI